MKTIHNKLEKRNFLIRSYPNLGKLEVAIGELLKNNSANLQLSVLGKLTEDLVLESKEAITAKTDLQDFLKRVLEPNTEFAVFCNHEIGTIFIAGFLVPQFLHDMNGKVLGALPSGPYGIIRGLGITEANANDHIMDLNKKCLLLILRGFTKDLNRIEAFI